MSISITGDIRRLSRALSNLGNLEMKKANIAVGEILKQSTNERFRTKKDPQEKPWKPSQENRNTLIKTSQLKNSIRCKADTKNIKLGSNLIYAATHQLGSKRTIKAKTSKGLKFMINGQWITKKVVKISIPARPYLGISKDDMKEIKDTLMDILEDATS